MRRRLWPPVCLRGRADECSVWKSEYETLRCGFDGGQNEELRERELVRRTHGILLGFNTWELATWRSIVSVAAQQSAHSQRSLELHRVGRVQMTR